MTKNFCDGCGNEIKINDLHLILHESYPYRAETIRYELCGSCDEQVKAICTHKTRVQKFNETMKENGAHPSKQGAVFNG